MAAEDYSSNDGHEYQTGTQEPLEESQYGEPKSSLPGWTYDFTSTPFQERDIKRTDTEISFDWDDVKRDVTFDGNRVSDLPSSTEARLRVETPDEILESYGVKVVFPRKHGNLFVVLNPINPSLLPIMSNIIDFTEVKVATQSEVKKALAKCLTFYPRDFLRKYGINTLYVANMKGDTVGFYNTITRAFVLSPDSLVGEFAGPENFHHELNHLLEHQTSEGKRFKRKWERKFPRITRLKVLLRILTGKPLDKNIQVYKGRKFEKLSNTQLSYRHFNQYGSYSPEEDRSTTLEQIFIDPNIVGKLADLPRIKREKIEETMSFFHELDGRMDTKFWADYAMGLVDSNYWRTRS